MNSTARSTAWPRSATTDLGDVFRTSGRVIVPAENEGALASLRQLVERITAAQLGVSEREIGAKFLDSVHERVAPAELNELRLTVIRGIQNEAWTREAYHSLAQHALELLCGNELAMQRRLNLSIQLPGDSSSLLPIHTDVWSGDSPYEIVLWTPLVDCFGTKGMYLVPPAPDRALRARFDDFARASAEDLYLAAERDADFVAVEYGQVMLFSPSLLHGNRVNIEQETRWSMNARFKGLFTPYGDKALGSFFEPLTIRPVTRLALDYQDPRGLDE